MTNFRLFIVLAAVCWQAQAQVLKVTNGARWGTFGHVENCPRGTYAGGLSVRVEGKQGWGDDTALNGIRLHCVRGGVSIDKYVESNPGYWGSWSSMKWCPAGFKSFKLKVESNQGAGDDTAANDVSLSCKTGGEVIGEGMPWGSWGDWSHTCAPDRVICGLETRIEGKGGDDTALNDVRFHCCRP